MTHISKLVLATLFFVVLSLTTTAAKADTINFDTGPTGTPINAPCCFSSATPLTTTYTSIGVTFSGPTANSGGAILDQSGNFGVNARSGTNFLAFSRDAFYNSGGLPTDPERITFAALQSNVSIYASGGFSAGIFIMEAFDNNGLLIESDLVFTPVGNYSLLSVSSGLGIRSVILIASPNLLSFVYDDLSFTPMGGTSAVPEPTTMLLLGTGLVGVAAKVRKRRKSHQSETV